VGHRDDPLAFTRRELCSWNHRFDDLRRRFRTIYCAEDSRTSLREVLADFRPKLSAIRAFADAFGEDALDDLSSHPVTASWREQHVLAPAHARLDGPIVDLNDAGMRAELEKRHAALLAEHALDHLDLHEITSRRRIITQTIAADLFDHREAAAVRFPSRLDGKPALALFEDRGELVAAGEPIELTDPTPASLVEVCAEWDLTLE
jgi:RES domain